MTSTEPKPFGFRVRRETGVVDWLTNREPPEDHWSVSLPHQCDGWDIAGDSYIDGLPHAEAVAELQRFIVEATKALDALRDRNETHKPDRSAATHEFAEEQS